MAKLGSFWMAWSSRGTAASNSTLSHLSRACWKRARASFEDVVIGTSAGFFF